MTFKIHGKIKAKQRPKFGQGRTYTPTDTINYENYIKILYQQECKKHFTGPVKMVITAYFQMPASKIKTERALKKFLSELPYPAKKPDADNIGKIVADSINGIAYKDDSQVVDMQIFKKWSNAEEYVEVEIIEM